MFITNQLRSVRNNKQPSSSLSSHHPISLPSCPFSLTRCARGGNLVRFYGGKGESSNPALSVANNDKTLHDLKNELQSLQERISEVQNAIRYYRDDKKKRVLILGAGRSSGYCIDYLIKHAAQGNWVVRIGDMDIRQAEMRIAVANNNCTFSENAVPFHFDIDNLNQRRREIADADLVISLLPALNHDVIAEECVGLKKDMLTASYVSEKMKQLDEKAKANGVLLLNEMGLDPGIDHMSCMRVVNEIQENGGDLRSLETLCGGLVAPESDNNPWHYKFTWNPRNVVLAGTGGVKFIQNGEYKYIPYHKVFSRIETIRVQGVPRELEGYANRDSLKYRSKYQLEHIPTFFRGTLRFAGFCKAWDIFVQLGMTDDTYRIEDSEHMTYRKFINSFLMYRKHDSVELKLAYHLGVSIDSPEMEALKWIGVFEDRQIGLKNATPAEILQSLLERKWKMRPEDKDMIVMYNKFLYDNQSGTPMEYISSLVVKGENAEKTAMSKTVGLPLAIAAHMVLDGRIDMTGVQVPMIKSIYQPILEELEKYDIKFDNFEKHLPLDY